MNYYEKKEFLENCIELGIKLEKKTNNKYELLIGWITNEFGDLPVTLCLNEDYWFGEHWNQQVVLSNAGNFTPVKNPYLELNKLIEKIYNDKRHNEI